MDTEHRRRGQNPELTYPGDDVVDIVGTDFYYNTAWDSRDPLEAWNYLVNEKYCFQRHQDFAATHHKMTAYAEWGLTLMRLDRLFLKPPNGSTVTTSCIKTIRIRTPTLLVG